MKIIYVAKFMTKDYEIKLLIKHIFTPLRRNCNVKSTRLYRS